MENDGEPAHDFNLKVEVKDKGALRGGGADQVPVDSEMSWHILH